MNFKMILSISLILFLLGCADILKNGKEFTFRKPNNLDSSYHSISILPHIFTPSELVENQVSGCVDVIQNQCRYHMKKRGFEVTDEKAVEEAIASSSIPHWSEIEPADYITQVGSKLDSDTLLVIKVSQWATGGWFGGNPLDMELTLYSGKTGEEIWYGRMDVKHPLSTDCKEKVLDKVLDDFFIRLHRYNAKRQ